MPTPTSYVKLVRYNDPAMGSGYNPRAIQHYVDVHDLVGPAGPAVIQTGSSGEVAKMIAEGTETVTLNGSGASWISAISDHAYLDTQIGSVKYRIALAVEVIIPTRVADLLRQEGWIR
jgi:hypothetical protein